jgi:small conductance mechanosensitive channel
MLCMSHCNSRTLAGLYRRAAILIVVLALACAATPAQEKDAEPVPEAELSKLELARQKLELLDASRSEAESLISRSKVASGEQRDLLRIEGLKVLDDLRELAGDLVKAIPALEDPPDVVDPLRRATADHLEYQGRLVLRDHQRKARILADLRRQRDTRAVGDLVELEDLINNERVHLDFGQTLGREVVRHLEALGLPDEDLDQEIQNLLIERADALGMRLQLAAAARDRLQHQVDSAKRIGANDKEQEIRPRLQAVTLRIDGIVVSLQKTADILQSLEIDTAEYRTTVIQATGEITEDILDAKVLIGLIGDALKDVLNWARDQGPTALFRIIVVFAFILLFRWGGGLLWLATRMILRPSKLLAGMFGRMIRPVASVTGLFFGLWFLGANPAALLTGVGVAGVIIGFALQESLGSLAAGVFILVYRPYDEGDTVSVGGTLGTVKEMGLANTTITTFDNRRVFVPNRKVWSEVIENRSAEPTRRVDTTVRITYREDIDRALVLIREILARHELILNEPETDVFVSDLSDSHVEIAVRPWTKVETWWPLTMDLKRVLTIGLREAGVEVPYPRTEILGQADGLK